MAKEFKKMNPDNLIAALSYAHILFIIPLLMKRDDDFTQFHAKQGLVLFLAESVLGIIFFFSIVVPVLFVAVSVFGFIKAMQGERWEMPILGKYAKNVKF